MVNPIDQRMTGYDWKEVAQALEGQGWAILPSLLTGAECRDVAGLYAAKEGFRSQVIMARHGYGRGQYRYFAYPLPPIVADLRTSLYRFLAPTAHEWQDRLRLPGRFPEDHPSFLERCHASGQSRPTPLLLEYGTGDYNCLHQDLYGEHVFPLQVAILLSPPGSDFTGGEFVLTEQRPRMQSRVDVVPLEQGDAVIFPVNVRPVRGTRGDYRVKMRHGVATVRSGQRHTLGIIFHDAT